MLLRCLSLAANYFLGSPAALFLLENRSRSSKFVSIEIDRNTKVQVITSTIDQFISKFFKLVVTNYICSYTLVYCEFAYISLLLENDQIFAKNAKNIVFGRTSSFFEFSKKKMTPIFLMRNPKLVLVLNLDSYSENASVGPLCNPWPIQL